jgi:hypothetical protein
MALFQSLGAGLATGRMEVADATEHAHVAAGKAYQPGCGGRRPSVGTSAGSGDPRTTRRETRAQRGGRPAHNETGDPRTTCDKAGGQSLFSQSRREGQTPAAQPSPAEPYTRQNSASTLFTGDYSASIHASTIASYDVCASASSLVQVRGPRSEDGATRPSISDL